MRSEKLSFQASIIVLKMEAFVINDGLFNNNRDT